VDALGLELVRVVVADQSVVVDASIAPRVALFLRDVQQAGIHLPVTSGYRTRAQQEELLARRARGEIRRPVASANESPHRCGCAIDVAMESLMRRSVAQSMLLVYLAWRHDLPWGGFWRNKDYVHFGATSADPALRAQNDANPTPQRTMTASSGQSVVVTAAAPWIEPELPSTEGEYAAPVTGTIERHGAIHVTRSFWVMTGLGSTQYTIDGIDYSHLAWFYENRRTPIGGFRK
jgi:hypothetical protein